MNFKTLLLSSTLALTTIIAGVSSVEARPNRIVKHVTSNGTEVFFKPIGSSGVEVLINNKYSQTGFIANMNCSNGRYQWRSNDGYSETQIKNILVDACNF